MAANDLDLLSPKGRQAFVSDCKHEALRVDCFDETVDLCADGHHLYGLSTMLCVALPGILFGLSDFINYRGFSFGQLLGNPFLRDWPMGLKLLLVPFYLVLMVPLVMLLTIYK